MNYNIIAHAIYLNGAQYSIYYGKKNIVNFFQVGNEKNQTSFKLECFKDDFIY